ncbi:PadR family transcriptional regulator [Alkalicella caledoniensis]|uniref:PadR family transcriptional regulator n=1 Tax=Alkalicella caledoniensis TaxID=2731377 RepID=A0A7G9W683_ALKCA|nr:PadR family transcriptional regulator [Alkalicella caledoniensis]QNO14195.1 PadR family transcriptional regulator [Alkalicella caledoniensis]
MNKIGRQLKKGVIDILILKLLSIENMYGYQLIQELDNKSDSVFLMKEGTLYPILYRLEDNNLIESYWDKEDAKRKVPRKYYKIKDEGLNELENMKEELDVLFNAVESIMNLGGV